MIMKTFLCKTGNLLSAIANIKFIVKYKISSCDVLRFNIDEILSFITENTRLPCLIENS